MRDIHEQTSEISNIGVNAQEIAAPANTLDAMRGASGAAVTPDIPSREAKPPEQSLEERREQAARRRREEMRAAVDEAVAAERTRWQSYVETLAVPEAEDAPSSPEPQVPGDEDTASDIPQAFYEEIFGLPTLPAEGTPSPDSAGEVSAAAMVQVYGQMQELIRERSRGELRRQLTKLQEFDPTVQSLESLLEGVQSAEFGRNFAATGDLLKAYKLTYFDALRERSQRTARLQRSYSTQSRAHLQRSAVRGSGAPQLTGDIVDAYRVIDPDVSIEEIRRYEAKYHGRNPHGV